MWMAWGPELTFFCNDAYRRDTLGKKYPWALGRPAREVWAEIWPDIGPRIEPCCARGEATWDEALLLFLERSGYTEETYHTFSYSPLTDDDGEIAGMLCVVSEDTERVIGERRMATLRDLGSGPGDAAPSEEVLAAASPAPGAQPARLPFTLIYLFDEDGDTARLAGVDRDRARAPAAPAASASATRPRVAGRRAGRRERRVDDLDELAFADLPTRRVGRAARRRRSSCRCRSRAAAARTASSSPALNRYRPLDDDYRGFVGLVAGQLAAGIAERPRVRGRAPARRGAGRARPRQDRRSSPTSATSCARR